MVREGSAKADQGRNGTRKAALILLYVVLAMLPLGISVGSRAMEGMLPGDVLGKSFALLGMAMLMLQPVLASRFHWIERPFGLDRLLGFHRIAGILAGGLLVLHPVMLALGRRGMEFLTRSGLPWFLTLGRATLLLLFMFVLASLFRAALRIPFQKWLRFHGALTPLILAGAFVHAWRVAVMHQEPLARWVWIGLAAAGLFGWLHLMLVQRLWGRRRPFEVTRVTSLTSNVWDLELAPKKGKRLFPYLPGQFLFVTLLRKKGLPREEHPFTLSSSPTRRDALTLTCKASGDYTATLGRTLPGDRAVVSAPFGRFSHLLRKPRRRLVFIAGGIGVTPMLSMLRYMRDTEEDREVLLIWANRTEGDILFREELSAMASLERPKVSVVHVLSRPGPEWAGEKGYADAPFLKRTVGDMRDRAFYLCGPPPMMRGVAAALKALGVPSGEIHMERFAL